MPLPHAAQYGNGKRRRYRIEHRDRNEYRGPASGGLLEKGSRRPTQDRADSLGDVEETVIRRRVFRPERVSECGGK